MPATGSANLPINDRGRSSVNNLGTVYRGPGRRQVQKTNSTAADMAANGRTPKGGLKVSGFTYKDALERAATRARVTSRKARVASAKPKPNTAIQRAANARRAAAGFARSKAQAAERKRRK